MVSKKGFSAAQVLIFIIAGIVFALILVFGYSAVSDMLKSSSDIMIVELKSDLESSIASVKRSFGSVRKVDLRVPESVEELCFFDFGKCNLLSGVLSSSGKPLDWAVSACASGSSNVFSIPRDVELSISDIRTDSAFVCVRAQAGVVSVRLTGKGDSVLVGEWY